MRIWLNGRASSFQVDHAGSIPAVRSMITRNWCRVHVPLAAWEPGDPYHALRPRGRQAPTAQHVSTRARGRRRSLRMWFNGRTAASQVAGAGSTPAIRSHRSCSRGPVVRAPRLHRGHHGFESHREHDRSRGCGSTGRASRQQREGRGFDSRHLHQADDQLSIETCSMTFGPMYAHPRASHRLRARDRLRNPITCPHSSTGRAALS